MTIVLGPKAGPHDYIEIAWQGGSYRIASRSIEQLDMNLPRNEVGVQRYGHDWERFENVLDVTFSQG